MFNIYNIYLYYIHYRLYFLPGYTREKEIFKNSTGNNRKYVNTPMWPLLQLWNTASSQIRFGKVQQEETSDHKN